MKPFFSNYNHRKTNWSALICRTIGSALLGWCRTPPPLSKQQSSRAAWWSRGAVEPWSRRRRQEEWSPFLSIFARSWKTITMLDHYVNYPEKTTILTETQPYLRSRPFTSDMCDNQDGNKTPPIVVG